jgi:hypothetical protein
MKKLFKKNITYLFSVIPLTLIVFTIKLRSVENFISTSCLTPVLNKTKTFDDLPCGFVAKGPMLHPQKPTFVTNNYIPILQYPTGNFPGTNVQIYNSIYSEHQTDQLIIQEDGNLVLYCITCTPVKPLWSAQTRGKDGKALFFQADGDLVLRNSLGKTVWHSNIHSKCAGSERAYFSLQDDGNLVMLYDQNTDNTGATYYLGSTGSTNDQLKSSHPGKIE